MQFKVNLDHKYRKNLKFKVKVTLQVQLALINEMNKFVVAAIKNKII